ncbi:O-succinylbenzoate synthase [Nocardioides thalensis]|uniref:o-succinylbenzoate synthase n=1 Tax=Nocardioides thalensis TaxID=1914755 RepID=A0A853BYT0_9ACTN|nr:o-succinylbenzoate synthase [Nocardioides thalensis]NYI99641.1 O-succinylbenzoate synthase [Nocardioides thalensis]
MELRWLSLPLVAPFRTSFGIQTHREALLLHVVGDEADGWGECVALAEPVYSAEHTDGAAHVIEHHLFPRLTGRDPSAADVAALLRPVRGHRMAKAALEMAVLDAELRAADTSFADYLGASRSEVASGVSVGIMDSIDELVTAVAAYLDQGYARIKLKIEPGWDVEPVRAVRAAFPDQPLQVDGNAAYGREHIAHLRGLDEFGLLLLEQPFDEEDVVGHAELARSVATPICLDESITSLQTALDAVELGACSIVNIKPGRVGGYLEARRIHDACLEAGVPVWCGGMLETGIGRAANIALASLPGFTLPGDISGSDRFYAVDITEPVEMVGGRVSVPAGPGFGRSPVPGTLERFTRRSIWLRA